MAIISERFDFSTSSLDKEAGVARGLLICGPKSKKGRTYPESTRSRAAHLYEGAEVNLDHKLARSLGLSKGSDAADVNRGVMEKVGRLTRPRDDPQRGLVADFEYLRNHPFAKIFEEYHERMPEQIGFSHVVDGRTNGPAGKEIVEDITKVFSADIVGSPGTTNGLFESSDPLDDPARQAAMVMLCDPNLSTTKAKEKVMLLFEDDKDEETQDNDSPEEQDNDSATSTDQPKREQPAEPARGIQPASESVVEQVGQLLTEMKDLQASLHSTQHELAIAQCLESHKIDRSRLSEEQFAYLDQQPNREAMNRYAESLPPMVRTNPIMPDLPRKETKTSQSYDQVRKDMEKRFNLQPSA